MKRWIQTLTKGTFALGIAVALTFGVMQTPAGAVEWPECDDFLGHGEIGNCPPFSPITCDLTCRVVYKADFGECMEGPPPDPCCICAI